MKGYSETLEYLFSLEKFGTVFGLENIGWLLTLLGNPHETFKTIHVGGTNGKGSVARMLSGILETSGYRTGRYTSPHLISFTERIAVDETAITEEEVVEITNLLRRATDTADPHHFFTFFDFTTALAFDYFRRKETDLAVIEVGLGGRLDSTNVISPLVSVITNVEMDHADYLGDTIDQIAAEKAGIIKTGIPTVTAARGGPLEVLRGVAKERGSRLYVLGEDFFFEKTGDSLMSYQGIGRSLENIRVNLKGDHQLENGAVALCCLEMLHDIGFNLPENAIRYALSTIEWAGRIEVVGENPTLLLDGAHNPHGVRALALYLKQHHDHRRKILIFGVMKDKDFGEMLGLLVPLMDKVILTRPVTDRAASPDGLMAFAEKALTRPDLRSALETAKALAGEGDMIVITGSLYTVGEAKKYIHEVF
jgi:dihydrofolate synthase / folylpolyglutamate synthase